MATSQGPIEMDVKSAESGGRPSTIRTWNSYSFQRNLLTPASPFRFTAPGVEKDERMAIRSGDTISLFAVGDDGKKQGLATGFIDETDTHITPSMVEYVLSGRDTLGQLVDNSSVDSNNAIVNTTSLSLDSLIANIIANTRIPKSYLLQQVPNGKLLFQTNPGETKINSLQRYLEFTNCLIWSMPDGRLKIGKPNFTQPSSGSLVSSSTSNKNNMLECRVRRNLNQAIRQIVTQLQTMDQVQAAPYTVLNADQDVRAVANAGVGRSVYRRFSYGNGNDSVNTIVAVGNSTGAPRTIGNELSQREIAMENMKVLDVEAVVEGHMNDNGKVYNVDQIYSVLIDDEDVEEDMLVYDVSYEMTMDHGLITRMRLCRLGTIVAYADALVRRG